MTRRLLRLWVFEWRKLLARRLPTGAFLAVVAIALASPAIGHVVDTAASLQQRGRVAGEDLYANGWTALCGSVQSTRLFLVLVLLVLAGSSMAEESAHGTLQALLMRPVRRLEVLLAKALAMWSYGVALFVVAVAAAALGGELTRGLYDVVDPVYTDRLVHAFGDMCTYVTVATLLTLPALAALTAMGVLVSVLFEHPGHATGVAIGWLFLLSAVSGFDQGGAGELLFVSYLNAPFDAVADLAEQVTNARAGLRPEPVLRAVFVPLVWSVVLFGITAGLFARRDVGRGG